ncbi:MAG: hypothetical protein MSG64_03880 [Pyrinomonadaceae bacterium MAG19_C2-C3]|nr:hypothetical protein [Pyrinomonadaceae bacterium MAG19_C2-C3]
MKSTYHRLHIISGLLIAAVLAMPGSSVAQQRTTKKRGQVGASDKQPSKPKLFVKVTSKSPFVITLRTVDAPLVEVAARISEQTRIPIELSPVMQAQRVTLNFKGIDLESLVRTLAPQPFIDYVVSGDPKEPQQKIVAIYLHAYNEDPPGASVATRDNFEAFILEANTDLPEDEAKADTEKADKKPILEVGYEKSLLSVSARSQPLTAVLYKIAELIGVPFDMQYMSVEFVDINFKDYVLQDAMRSLSPQVRLYIRTDFQANETKPVRLVLVEPSNLTS